MVIYKNTTRREFLNRHGDKVGYCAMTVTDDGFKIYATIEAEMPHYSEYTHWDNIDECRVSFEQDIEYYRNEILSGKYDEEV